MFNPKVSVIVPLYNCEKYIEQCLDSIFAQSYKNLEVFCIDNESKDNSYNIIKRLKEEKYPQLIIDTAPNIYPFCWEEARDKALEKMTGDYCLIMASDDYLENDFIKRYVQIFSKAPNTILALQSGIMGVQDGRQ
jgi:glycosyltransferase EpsH